VSDQHDEAVSLAVLLKQWGHEPQVASDDESTMAVVEAVRPHVLIYDLGNDSNATDPMLKQIRQQPWGQQTAFIGLGDVSLSGQFPSIAGSPLSRILQKPLDEAHLQSCLLDIGHAQTLG
jgi:hypothetical protein